MPSFVHTADIHLDSAFSARLLPRKAELRRKEVMMTFQDIVKKAGEADFFFISGDLFDSSFVYPETVSFLKRCFTSIPNTHVFISAGNHDPLTSDSLYNNTDFGDNVHVFSGDGEFFDFPELKTRIHGISFTKEHAEEPLLPTSEPAEGWCNILVVHGEVSAPGAASAYNPIYSDYLEKSGMTYAALGHIHKYSGIKRAGGVYYAYPGIPEGRGFDEDGDRGYIRGRCDNGVVSAEWTVSCRRKLEHLDIDLTGCNDGIEIFERIKNNIDNCGTDNIYKVNLCGRLKHSYLNYDLLSKQLEDCVFYAELSDNTEPEYDINRIAKEPGLKGEFVAAMLEKAAELKEEEKRTVYLAIQLGIEAMKEGDAV